jgi:hypothetical protein
MLPRLNETLGKIESVALQIFSRITFSFANLQSRKMKVATFQASENSKPLRTFHRKCSA